MIIVMSPQATQQELDKVVKKLTDAGLRVHLSEGTVRTIIGVIGDKKLIADLPVEAMSGVEKTVSVTESYKLVGRDFKQEDSVVDVGGVKIGGEHLVVMAGPCAVESREQLFEAAEIVKKAGA
ncbi:MAG: 3-deoxy-7-phosphoheptulonate synthase, partial [Pelosinus sp.]|nr:3-deoxy-7-phosphoheptulonate synthase [Pelosinus sp.]